MKESKEKLQVETTVKDAQLIEFRRQQIINAAIVLFKEKGFHRATTREIAKVAGFSIGTLYEYVRTKEDVLYLLCDSIYHEVRQRLDSFPQHSGTVDELKEAIKQYFFVIDSMSDAFTIMYQESKSLSTEALHYVLNKELEMVALFEKLLKNCTELGILKLSEQELFLAANHIVIQGQSWAFRRWALHKHCTIDEFIAYQTNTLLNGILRKE
ncbi:TetR/AcrR family transcriptional regulator [Metasolibacillus sp.]|uniref:TetR/AcrR family transcriptional regulator n=1 Tax=Metasolibacillus sp. TaxID=2703680 RepID=UPI0025DE6AC3|nr:TetR/AcrR family transcriptional regulator [Metasolibacillus sp.]MCT6923462.1 TetR/AcrR family transcriptional regulator [Metasolibacillus sp.]MCT6939816.1 TetR/AcrR family transcriptional regulator [Metasolibacillus sp.]